ncbi:Copper transporter ctr4 [Apiospora arundinis]
MDHGTMNHDSMSMTMDMATPTGTGLATATSAASMGGMSHGGMGGAMGGCKISMLWNWNTVDSCFISSSWRVTSSGMFAGSCIGVILLVMCLELLRRAVKEYDRYLIRQHASAQNQMGVVHEVQQDRKPSSGSGSGPFKGCSAADPPRFRPTVLQQAVRALLHTLQFAVAYFVMLLAMYYNGYIIICIFIGAYIGSFVFQWETLGGKRDATSASGEATVCCG